MVQAWSDQLLLNRGRADPPPEIACGAVAWTATARARSTGSDPVPVAGNVSSAAMAAIVRTMRRGSKRLPLGDGRIIMPSCGRDARRVREQHDAARPRIDRVS
jgi:hypothetical protein